MSTVVGLCGMTYNTRKPYMGGSFLPYRFKYRCGKVIELTASIIRNATILLPRRISVAIKARKELVDNNLIV